MSCGRPHATPCTTVLSLVHAYTDGEVTEVQRIDIVQHLQECPPCDEQFQTVRAVKVLVQRSGGAAAPDRLRAEIVTRIRTVAAAPAPDAPGE